MSEISFSRRDGLKIIGTAAAATTGIYILNRLGISPFHKLESNRGDPSKGIIPEIVNTDAPFSKSIQNLQSDPLGVLTEGWQTDPKYEPASMLSDPFNVSPRDPQLEAYQYKHTPSKSDIPPEILHTEPFHALPLDEIPQFRQIRRIIRTKPEAALELILKTLSPATRGLLFPEKEIAAGLEGYRAQQLWKHKETIHNLNKLAERQISAYADFQHNQPTHGNIRNIQSAIQSIETFRTEELKPNLDDTILEICGVAGNPYYIVNNKIWTHANDVTGRFPSICYLFTANVVHAINWAKDTLQESPLTVNNNGRYNLQHIENGQLELSSVGNLFQWFRDASSRFGWEDVSMENEETLANTHGKVIIGFKIENGDPIHSFLARPNHDIYPGKPILDVADVSKPPEADLHLLPKGVPITYQKPDECMLFSYNIAG